ncbi:hypothetical protein HLB42_07675 [Deinococcus sp. D7000]|nr:hypothetical protein HLB42_07675 [Deinococcus sp. D7000]
MANSFYAMSVVRGEQLAWAQQAHEQDRSIPEIVFLAASLQWFHFQVASSGWKKTNAMNIVGACEKECRPAVLSNTNGPNELVAFEVAAHRAVRHSNLWRRNSRHRLAVLFLAWVDLARVHRLMRFGSCDVIGINSIGRIIKKNVHRKEFLRLLEHVSLDQLVDEFLVAIINEKENYSDFSKIYVDPGISEMYRVLSSASKKDPCGYLFEAEIEEYVPIALYYLRALDRRIDFTTIFHTYTQRQKAKYQALYQLVRSALDIAAYYFLINQRVKFATQFIQIQLPLYAHPRPPTAPQAPPA